MTLRTMTLRTIALRTIALRTMAFCIDAFLVNRIVFVLSRLTLIIPFYHHCAGPLTASPHNRQTG
ncbi:MAG: hypothetical protein P8144_06230 [Gammaproteobacteria bacterium]